MISRRKPAPKGSIGFSKIMKYRTQTPAVSAKRRTKSGALRKSMGAKWENRIKKVYMVYKKALSMTETGKTFGISGERVRQLLQRGDAEGIIRFLPAETLRISGLLNKIDKFDLIRDIENARHADEILSKYVIGYNELYRLLKFFGLNYSAIKTSARITRCVREYLQILNILNHHPSTFDLQSNKSWRPLHNRICFTWGTLSKFRRAFGFPKPPRINRREGC